MAYETGSATGINDLLDKFRAFAVANGWTANRFTTQGSGKWLNIEKSGLVFNVVSDPTSGSSGDPAGWLLCYGATSYNSGAAYNAQPNSSGLSKVNGLGTGSITAYHFFAGTEYLYAAIEVTSGVYRHLHLGSLTKFGTFTGGAFIMGTAIYTSGTVTITDLTNQVPWFSTGSSNSQNRIRADINGATNKWFGMQASATITSRAIGGVSYYDDYGYMGPLIRDNPNALNGLAVMQPVHIMCGNSNNLYNPIGYAPDLRLVRLDNLNPADVVTIAGVDWMVFPVYQKAAGGGLTYGYAIKKVA